MKRLFQLLLCILQLLSTTAEGQYDFAPLGAEWTFNQHSFNGNNVTCESDQCNLTWITLLVDNEETINGKIFSKISSKNNNTGEITPTEISFHQVGDSIFFQYQDTLRLLYDFSAKDGDEIQIYIPNFVENSGPITFNSSNYPPIIPVTVQVFFEDSVSVNGEMRRMVQYYDNENNFEIRNIIDGIGSTVSLFGRSSYLVAEGCGGYFWCYIDPETSYTPAGCCAIPMGPNSTQKEDYININIYPNPTSNFLNIDSDNLSSTAEYTIHSMEGKVVKTGYINNSAIDLSLLPKGILFISVTDQLQVFHKQIVKN